MQPIFGVFFRVLLHYRVKWYFRQHFGLYFFILDIFKMSNFQKWARFFFGNLYWSKNTIYYLIWGKSSVSTRWCVRRICCYLRTWSRWISRCCDSGRCCSGRWRISWRNWWCRCSFICVCRRRCRNVIGWQSYGRRIIRRKRRCHSNLIWRGGSFIWWWIIRDRKSVV